MVFEADNKTVITCLLTISVNALYLYVSISYSTN